MNVRHPNVINVKVKKHYKMNNLDINRHLLAGDTSTKGVLPHLEELPSLPFVFDQNFGLQQLPAEPGMLMIRGPRQYGKSTWLEAQIKRTIIEYGAGSALYLNGDEIATYVDLLEELRNLLTLFPTNTSVKRIFIDEITAIVNWQTAVKRLADAGELKDILLITTGSKAVDLRNGFERLPGRKGQLDRTDYIFTPISYSEFSAKCATTFGDDTLYAFIISGGSAIGANSLARHGCIAEYVVNTIGDWIYGEFARAGRSRANLMAVLASLYKFSPNPIGHAKLARESGLANNTVAKGYIELLADLMLVLPAYPYDVEKNINIFRKECKFHFINTLFAISMHPSKPRSIADLKALTPEAFAPILEWVVAQEIWRQSCIANQMPDFLNFWQTTNHEVDFLMPGPNVWLEVKSGKENAANFLWFPKMLHNNQILTVINKNKFAAQRIKGTSVEDFLLSKLFA